MKEVHPSPSALNEHSAPPPEKDRSGGQPVDPPITDADLFGSLGGELPEPRQLSPFGLNPIEVPATDGRWVLYAPTEESLWIEAFRQAWANSVQDGIGFYPPSPATIATAPDLEVWRHRDPVLPAVEEIVE